MKIKLNNTKGLANVWWGIFEQLPILVPVAIAVFGSVAMFFLVIGAFNPIYIWPLGIFAIVLASLIVVRNYPIKEYGDISRNLCNLLVVLAILCWGGFNVLFTSQHVFVNRDPAVYTNAGIWLVKHDNLLIPSEHVFGNVAGLNIDNGTGFKQIAGSDGKTIYAQGLHLLSAYVGLVGRMLGVPKALHINVLFGMSALLSIYAVARILTRRTWWAVTVTAILAVSMPLLYFSRDMYTEPLATTLTFGGLAVLWIALRSNKFSPWLLAGALMGAGTMTRIDGYLTIAEILALIVVILVLASKQERLMTLRKSFLLTLGMVATAILGWLDASRLSTPYYRDLASSFNHEILAIVAVLLLGGMAVYVAWRTKLISMVIRATNAWRSELVVVGLIVVMLILLARPYLYKLAGMVDPISNYDAYSIGWITWYLGATITAIGVFGMLLAAERSLKQREPFMMAVLLVVIGTGLVYLIQPSIFPDQIWASRRMLPIIMPGILIFAAFALDWLSEKLGSQIRMKKIFIVLSSLSLIAVPLVISRPVLLLRPFKQIGSIQSICQSVPTNAAIVWIGAQSRQEIVQPVRSVCDIPSQSLLVNESLSLRETLALVAKHAKDNGRIPLIGLYGQPTKDVPLYAVSGLKLLTVNTYSDLEHTYLNAPQKANTAAVPIYLGRIKPDGRVVPFEMNE